MIGEIHDIIFFLSRKWHGEKSHSPANKILKSINDILFSHFQIYQYLYEYPLSIAALPIIILSYLYIVFNEHLDDGHLCLNAEQSLLSEMDETSLDLRIYGVFCKQKFHTGTRVY